jgi:hypothetical protein
MDIVFIDKCRYEIQELEEVPVRYTATYRSISSSVRICYENTSEQAY